MHHKSTLLALAGFAAITVALTADLHHHLPVVCLDYGTYRASTFNTTGDYYVFSNIRYAQAPIGNLRFRKPQDPIPDRTQIHNGSYGFSCPQALPTWGAIAEQFVAAYLERKFQPNDTFSSSGPSIYPLPTDVNEDCLFLDVYAPSAVLRKANSKAGLAPVLVWIHGGGYVSGSKSVSGDPAGLIARSRLSDPDGLVFVAINYRLGVFGWLSGPSLQVNGMANAGFYDQRHALEWIQKNIHLFGGDRKRVTVMGESAGGGSILAQITAFGGKNGPAPFQQAIPQSPAVEPYVSPYEQEGILQTFLGLLNVSTVQEARTLCSTKLQLANTVMVNASAYGRFTFGPVVDDTFMPAMPGKLLLLGDYDTSVKIMPGHNYDEGLVFTSPDTYDVLSFNTTIKNMFPDATDEVVGYISNVLYPPVFGESLPYIYNDNIARSALFYGEVVIACNTFFMNEAQNNHSFAYVFTQSPAIHGQDIDYTFFNGMTSTFLPNVTLAAIFQTYLTNFIVTGNPSMTTLPTFNNYGHNAQTQFMSSSYIGPAPDPSSNERCLWLQKTLFY